MSVLQSTFRLVLSDPKRIEPETFKTMFERSLARKDSLALSFIAKREDLPQELRKSIAGRKEKEVVLAWLSRQDLSEEEFESRFSKENRSDVLKQLFNSPHLKTEQKQKIKNRFLTRPTKALAEVFLEGETRELKFLAYSKLVENADSLSQTVQKRLEKVGEQLQLTDQEIEEIVKNAQPSRIIGNFIDNENLQAQEKATCLEGIYQNVDWWRYDYLSEEKREYRDRFFQKCQELKGTHPSEKLRELFKIIHLQSAHRGLREEEKVALTMLVETEDDINSPESVLSMLMRNPDSATIDTILAKVNNYPRMQAEILSTILTLSGANKTQKTQALNKLEPLFKALSINQRRIPNLLKENLTKAENALVAEKKMLERFYYQSWEIFIQSGLQPFTLHNDPQKLASKILKEINNSSSTSKSMTGYYFNPQALRLQNLLQVEALDRIQIALGSQWELLQHELRSYYWREESRQSAQTILKATTDAFEDNNAAWETFDTLASDFQGTFKELIETVKELT